MIDIEALKLTGEDLDKIDLELSTPFVISKVRAVADAQLAKALRGIKDQIMLMEMTHFRETGNYLSAVDIARILDVVLEEAGIPRQG